MEASQLVALLFERAAKIASSLKPAADTENSIQLQKTLLQHWNKRQLKNITYATIHITQYASVLGLFFF